VTDHRRTTVTEATETAAPALENARWTVLRLVRDPEHSAAYLLGVVALGDADNTYDFAHPDESCRQAGIAAVGRARQAVDAEVRTDALDGGRDWLAQQSNHTALRTHAAACKGELARQQADVDAAQTKATYASRHGSGNDAYAAELQLGAELGKLNALRKRHDAAQAALQAESARLIDGLVRQFVEQGQRQKGVANSRHDALVDQLNAAVAQLLPGIDREKRRFSVSERLATDYQQMARQLLGEG
jgi:hypothetical protein